MVRREAVGWVAAVPHECFCIACLSGILYQTNMRPNYTSKNKCFQIKFGNICFCWYNLVLLLISPPTTHHLCDDSMSYAL